MKNMHYARKKRQLKVLADNLQNQLLNKNNGSEGNIERLIQKIKRLINELFHVLSRSEMKKILGGIAVVLGISFSNNANGQTFVTPVTNPFGLDSAYFLAYPAITDLDNDGDLDILVGEYDGVMNYYQNIGTATNPQFAPPQTNPFGLSSTYYNAFPAFADIDNDGDMDLFVGEYYGVMKFFENIGTATNPQFGTQVASPFGIDTTYWAFPSLADLDNDGDFDLLAGEYSGAMNYYENIGTATNPQFTTAQVNPFGLDSAYQIACPNLVDLDNDGDFDLIVGEYYGNFRYFKNTGTPSNPQFAAAQINPFGLTPTYEWAFPASADLDNDGDIDLLVGEYYGALKYYENTVISKIDDIFIEADLNLFPNPVQDLLNIHSEKEIEKIEITDLQGRAIIISDNITKSIPVNSLSTGTYYVKIQFKEGNVIVKQIFKE